MRWELYLMITLAALTLLCIAPILLDYLIRDSPSDEAPTTRSRKLGSRKARINHLIQLAAHHLDQMEAIEEEFVGLHEHNQYSREADELRRVIRDREDYHQTLRRIEANQ